MFNRLNMKSIDLGDGTAIIVWEDGEVWVDQYRD